MLILNDKESMEYLEGFLLSFYKSDEYTGNPMGFRSEMLYLCYLIRNEQYERLRSSAIDIKMKQRGHPLYENCFRESLLFAKYMKLRKH